MQADSSIFYIGNMSMKGGGGGKGEKGGGGKGREGKGGVVPQKGIV